MLGCLLLVLKRNQDINIIIAQLISYVHLVAPVVHSFTKGICRYQKILLSQLTLGQRSFSNVCAKLQKGELALKSLALVPWYILKSSILNSCSNKYPQPRDA